MKQDVDRPKPLYRKVNTRTWGVQHGSGMAAKYERNTKAGARSSMHAGQRHGVDYTPLYRFLLKHVGLLWDDVSGKVKGRILSDEALDHIVALSKDQHRRTVRTGESSYFSGLMVDADGVLRRVAPMLENGDLHPFCKCCTHSFNGEVLVNTWTVERQGDGWS